MDVEPSSAVGEACQKELWHVVVLLRTGQDVHVVLTSPLVIQALCTKRLCGEEHQAVDTCSVRPRSCRTRLDTAPWSCKPCRVLRCEYWASLSTDAEGAPLRK